MINFVKRLIWGRELKDVIGATKKIKIRGVLFTIKKIDALNYLDGSKSIKMIYDTYTTESVTETSMKRIKSHYIDVFMSAIIKPVLVRKDNNKNVLVDEIFNDWGMAQELYESIMAFTYGKKKLQ